MQDLKAGFILNATPWKQQVMQIVGVVSAALVMAPILSLLLNAYGFEGQPSNSEPLSSVQTAETGLMDPILSQPLAQAEPQDTKKAPLAAPQANLMAAVAQGVFEGKLPWGFVGMGVLMGIAVIFLDVYLMKKGSTFRTPVLAVAIGIYLPLELEIPYEAGVWVYPAITRNQVARQMPTGQAEGGARRGILLASGLITGEALGGIRMSIPIVISEQRDIVAIIKEPSETVTMIGAIAGSVFLIGVGSWLYLCGKGSRVQG